jgi:hypothetical protein
MLLGVFGVFIHFSFSTPQAYAASQLQLVSLPQPSYTSRNSFSVSSEAVGPMPSAQSDAPILFDLVQELRTFPVGKKYNYYRQMLEEQGYIVLGNYNDNKHWEFDLEKMNQNLRLTIAHNSRTGHSTAITASGPRIADAEYVRR